MNCRNPIRLFVVSCVVVGAAAVAVFVLRDTSPRPHILLISIDTLRSDHVSVYGYERDTTPRMVEYFATSAHIYENAYATASYTPGSVISVLSGLYPHSHRIRDFYQLLAPEVWLLPDGLAELGYQTAAVVSNVVLTEEALGIGTRFDFYDDFVDERELNRDIYERRASRTTDAALSWLATRPDAEQPSFLWVHYIDPHGPYDPPTDEVPVTFSHEGTVALDENRLPFYQRLADVDDLLTYVDRYDGEVAYTDQEVGRLLDGYDELGFWREAIVILTADHGDNMIEHEAYFDHSFHVWNSMLRVPLMIRWPDLPGARISTPVSLVDLAPTMLAYLWLPLRPGMDGRPLEQRRFGDLLFQEAATSNRRGQPRSVIQGDNKWIAFASGQGEIVGNLFFNLREDPAEVSVTPWPVTGSLASAQLAEFIRVDPDPGGIPHDRLTGRGLTEPKYRNELEPHELEALRSLGYIR